MGLLDPHDRRLLLDALRPPDDYSLDFAVGTTFSLDLLALLTAPLGFTRFEIQETEGSRVADADAHLVLRTLREFSDRITIFCQAGRIAVPPGHRPLLSMLEQMVVEVMPPVANRVFHPKVWALRFTGDGGAVRYRLLVLSRNLTFAKSWDTVLVLDGELQDRANAIAANHPLGDFFAAMPDMSVRGLSDVARQRVERLQAEIRKVRFECPPDLSDISFHPLGIPGLRDRTFDGRTQRLLVVSPFLSTAKLQEIAQPGRRDVLISRWDQLQKLSTADLAMFEKIYALNPSAVAGDEADASIDPDPLAESTGLHAKCYIADDGYDAHIWTGSANATNAAFSGNVELLVRLTGKKSRFGVEAALSMADGAVGFVNMLQEFHPAVEPAIDEITEQLDELLEQARCTIASMPWQARVVRSHGDAHELSLDGAREGDKELADVYVYPTTLGSNRELPASVELVWENVSTEGLTSFYAFQVTRRIGNRTATCRFVLNVLLAGAPPNRQEVLLRSMLRDRAQVIRFLLLLLGDAEAEGGTWQQILVADGTAPVGFQMTEAQALLEPLLRTLECDPARLDQVDRLLRDLGAPNGESGPIPDGLPELFASIWQARGKART